MTETVTETTRYAIELPSGELVDDLGSWDRAGGVHSMLPNRQSAYLWDAPDVARSVRMQLSTDLTGYGLQTHFMQHSRVVEVRVRTTLEIRPVAEDHVEDDGIADAPIMEAHVVGLTEPRTWSSVTDIPVGTRFYDYLPNNVYERRESDCLHLASGSMYRLAAFRDELNIYVEVLPDPVEPRAWKATAEIPFGVRFVSAEHRNGPYSWLRFDLHSFREYVDGTESFVADIDLDRRYGDGFVEVLPTPVEPRTWKTAEEIPAGVVASPTSNPNFRFERVGHRGFRQYYQGKNDGLTGQQSLTDTWPEGFVEVLS